MTPDEAVRLLSEELDERCQSCGRLYRVVWAAEDGLWNEVVGSPYGLLCAECFYGECVKRNILPFFVAFREHVATDLRTENERLRDVNAEKLAAIHKYQDDVDHLREALREIDRACTHDLERLTGRAHSDMRPEDRTRSIRHIARTALAALEKKP